MDARAPAAPQKNSCGVLRAANSSALTARLLRCGAVARSTSRGHERRSRIPSRTLARSGTSTRSPDAIRLRGAAAGSATSASASGNGRGIARSQSPSPRWPRTRWPRTRAGRGPGFHLGCSKGIDSRCTGRRRWGRFFRRGCGRKSSGSSDRSSSTGSRPAQGRGHSGAYPARPEGCRRARHRVAGFGQEFLVQAPQSGSAFQ